MARATLLSRSRPLQASRLGRYLFPGLAGSVRQLLVQDHHVRLVLSDGSWLVFMQDELGIDRAALTLRSNEQAVRFVVDRALTWKARHQGQASLHEVDLQGTRVVATPAALAHYDLILSRTAGSPEQSEPEG